MKFFIGLFAALSATWGLGQLTWAQNAAENAYDPALITERASLDQSVECWKALDGSVSAQAAHTGLGERLQDWLKVSRARGYLPIAARSAEDVAQARAKMAEHAPISVWSDRALGAVTKLAKAERDGHRGAYLIAARSRSDATPTCYFQPEGERPENLGEADPKCLNLFQNRLAARVEFLDSLRLPFHESAKDLPEGKELYRALKDRHLRACDSAVNVAFPGLREKLVRATRPFELEAPTDTGGSAGQAQGN